MHALSSWQPQRPAAVGIVMQNLSGESRARTVQKISIQQIDDAFSMSGAKPE